MGQIVSEIFGLVFRVGAWYLVGYSIVMGLVALLVFLNFALLLAFLVVVS